MFICGGHHDSDHIAVLVMVSKAESIVLYPVFYIEPVRRPQADNFQPGLATLLLAGPTGRQLFV